MPSNITDRIKAIQKNIAATQTGVIDMETCLKLETALNIKPTGTSLTTHIKAIQRALNVGDDGIVGPVTLSRIEALIQPKLPPIPIGASMVISAKSLDLIVNAEVTSKDVYNQKYQSPIWPGGDSGVTVGIGFDCGYCSKQELADAWGTTLSAAQLALLQNTCGKKGATCKDLIPGIKSVKISYDAAVKVFYQHTLPACARDVKRTYPGIEKLPPDTQGAILSLVYNRGYLINDTDRRKEMKALKPIIAAGNLQGIAAQLRSMKRLWDPKKQKGLITRRENEALLVENGTFNILPENTIIV